MAVAFAGVLPAAAEPACRAPEPVCAVRDVIFQVSGFDPHGSAVRIAPGLLVTNRHVVADDVKVGITLKDGTTREGAVVPTSFGGDLILIRADLPEGPVATLGTETDGDLYTVAQDLGTKGARAFPKGRRLVAADPAKPYARLHHTAYTQPGNSGGALVNAKGELVGIATSGGEGRFEAVPAAQIAALQAVSGAAHAEQSVAIGKAYRVCTELLEKARRLKDALPPKVAGHVESSCVASDNRQLLDLAAQTLARSRMLDKSAALFERALAKDPNAINSRLGYAITLGFARRHKDAVPHLAWLLDVIPEETGVHRLAVQAGKFAGDTALVERTLALIAKHSPAQLEAAKRFLDAPAPRR